MKSNVRVVILALAVLTLLGWYQVLGTVGENREAYKEAIERAEQFTAEGIYEKALDAYAEALGYGDTERSMDIRKSMNELYLLCMEDDRIRYDVSGYEKFLSTMLNTYPADPEGYEMNVKYWYGRGKYLKCYDILQRAEKKEVSSAVLEEYKELIKYQCSLQSTRYTNFLPLCQGRMAVLTTDVWNYVSGTGRILLEGNYEEAQPFAEGLAIVRKNETLRIITEDGTVQRILSGDILAGAGCYGSGLAPVQTSSGYRYVDREGMLQLETYEYASTFCNGIAAVMKNGLWQIIDTEGNVLLDGLGDVALDGLGRCCAQNVILASSDGMYSLYAPDGTRTGAEVYENADAFEADGVAAVKRDGLWGYIDTEGNWLLDPQFENAESFSCGLAGISVDGMWGFIDASGETVIPCAYEDVGYWNEEGCCMVFSGGFWKLLERICYP